MRTGIDLFMAMNERNVYLMKINISEIPKNLNEVYSLDKPLCPLVTVRALPCVACNFDFLDSSEGLMSQV